MICTTLTSFSSSSTVWAPEFTRFRVELASEHQLRQRRHQLQRRTRGPTQVQHASTQHLDLEVVRNENTYCSCRALARPPANAVPRHSHRPMLSSTRTPGRDPQKQTLTGLWLCVEQCGGVVLLSLLCDVSLLSSPSTTRYHFKICS